MINAKIMIEKNRKTHAACLNGGKCTGLATLIRNKWPLTEKNGMDEAASTTVI